MSIPRVPSPGEPPAAKTPPRVKPSWAAGQLGAVACAWFAVAVACALAAVVFLLRAGASANDNPPPNGVAVAPGQGWYWLGQASTASLTALGAWTVGLFVRLKAEA